MKGGGNPALGIETEEVGSGTLCPGVLAARVWPSNSEFVKTVVC